MQAVLESPAAASGKAAVTLTNLKHALRVVAPAIASASDVLPILKTVRIGQQEAGLAVEATNLDIAIRALIPESNGPSSAIVVPAERFLSWVKLLNGEEVTISATSSRATVRCGEPKGVFPLMPSANWPSVAEIFKAPKNGLSLLQGALARALRFAQVAVSDDETRFALTAAYISGDGEKLKVVATTGYCMAIYTIPCPEKVKAFLLPGKVMKSVLPLLAESDAGVDINFDDKSVLVSIAGDMPVFVAGKLPQGSFPNYESVWPHDQRAAITVDSGAMLGCLERCALLADEKSESVMLTFGIEGKIAIDAADAEAGEASEKLPY